MQANNYKNKNSFILLEEKAEAASQLLGATLDAKSESRTTYRSTLRIHCHYGF